MKLHVGVFLLGVSSVLGQNATESATSDAPAPSGNATVPVVAVPPVASPPPTKGMCLKANRPNIPNLPKGIQYVTTALKDDCVSVFNDARARDTNGWSAGARALVWDEKLAQGSIGGSWYCGVYNPMVHAGPNTGPTGSKIQFGSKRTCRDSIQGWFWDEKNVWVRSTGGRRTWAEPWGHYANIASPSASRFGCSYVSNGRGCISCTFA